MQKLFKNKKKGYFCYKYVDIHWLETKQNGEKRWIAMDNTKNTLNSKTFTDHGA